MSSLAELLHTYENQVVGSDDRPVSRLLPLIFRLRGKPYDLQWSHFMFEPMFRLRNCPRVMLWKTARQVSKTTSLSAMQIIRAAAQPNYNILTIMPLFEQVRKLSQNYVRPFLVTSPIKRSLIGPDGSDSVLQRGIGDFDHNSNLFYSYSHGDPSRVRGIAASECLAEDTLVSMADGTQKPIQKLTPGDVVLSFSPGGITSDTVVRLVPKGIRPIWRLTFSDGGYLDATDNELINTSQGWKFLYELANDYAGEEIDNSRMAEPSDGSGLSLLVSGRRGNDRQNVNHQLPRVLPGGERAVGYLADREGLRCFRVYDQGLLVCRAAPRGGSPFSGCNPSMGTPQSSVQTRPTAPTPNDSMSELWEIISSQEQPSYRSVSSMSHARVLTLANKHPRTGTNALTGITSGEESAHPRTCESILPRKASTSSRASTCSVEPSGGEGSACAVSEELEGSAESFRLSSATVIGVAYLGEAVTYDVEIKNNHTLFANNYGVHNCNFDEIQDLPLDDLPVIESCMAASPFKIARYTGTPKTFDNTIHILWEDSSQAIWHIPCQTTGCKHLNRATVSGDLIQMLGEKTLTCAKCMQPLNSRLGFWVHDYPDRRMTFPGYHVPQPVLPMHYESPKDWYVLMENYRTKPTYVFYNETLGESFDSGAKLLTRDQLETAATIEPAGPGAFNINQYVDAMLGIDWGGRGKEKTTDSEDFISNTAFALAGLRSDGSIDIPWLHKIPYAIDISEESGLAVDCAKNTGISYIAMDYGGQGNVQEQRLIAGGFPKERIVPFTYNGSMSYRRPIVFYQPPRHFGVRSSYTLDKSRSILLLIELIKAGLVRLPKGQQFMENHLKDFLNIYEESIEDPRGPRRRIIRRMSKRTDDIVHAINFACMALFHRNGRWPKLAEAFMESPED